MDTVTVSSPWLLGLATLALATLLYWLLVNVFNRPSLPLPPGPKPWPIVGNMPHLGPMPHQALASLARLHGPLMHLRIGVVDIVVAASASVAEQFLKVQDANFLSRPPNAGAKYLMYNYHDLLFAPYGPRWRMLRKITAVHMFSSKALDDCRHFRQEEARRLVTNLANVGSSAVNLGQLVNICVTNALARAMLGRRVFNDISGGSDPKAEEFKSMVMEMMELGGVFNISDFIPALEWLDIQGVHAKMKKLHKRFDSFLTNIVEEHKVSKNHNHRDLLTTLLSLKEVQNDEGATLTNVEIKALLMNLFAGGTDTTTSTTEWAMSELIKHPTMLARVRHESDSVVGRDRLVNESDLQNLPYLQAFIKETFRLHPPTALSLPRIADSDCEIFGYRIPKGATLLVDIWAIGRDPKEWSDPTLFRPERFLPGGEKADVDIKGYDFEAIPFGAGRRICPGVSLGICMVQLLTATMAHAFEWDLQGGLDPEKLNMEEAYGITLQRKVPLSVNPRPRLAPHVYSQLV
ncbi:hypothetical protein QN277_014502 [Acacia crassicarpa]|uniref:Flavonoid 3'-hydroxylase n=1 Tax=Acacia crassicarpa TaxID=499986 RepID=A0AAE1IMH4_9FABA|nr:hypothetical protein QN277_014502 [Acacia crassicarpa]